MYGVAIHKLPPFGAKRVGRKEQQVQTTRIICDFILGYEDKLFLIDTKSLHKDRLNHSYAITPSFKHQILELNRIQQNLTAHRTGFIVQYRNLDTVVYFTAQQLLNLEPTQGLGVKDGLVLSTNNELPDIRLIFA